MKTVGLPALYAFTAIAVVSTLLFIGAVALSYWADSYASPGWNEQSVPAARAY
jgi:hypothetical protein